MRIGVDGTMLSGYKFGIGHYVTSLLQSLAVVEPEAEFIIYTNSKLKIFENLKNLKVRVMPLKDRFFLLQAAVPKQLKADHIDLFWGGNYALPLFTNGVKKVVTIHDFVYKRFPETLPAKTVKHLNLAMPFYLRSADHVLVDSESTMRDLNEYYSYPSQHVTVVPLASRREFFCDQNGKTVETVLNKYSIEKGYLLFVGTVEPRKGITTIIEALSIYQQKHKASPRLVVAGKFGWKTEVIFSLLEKHLLKSSVTFLDYVEDVDLPAIYQGATIFLYPSFYEGFGLPVLEAMASGIPVITSTSSSLPEVGGDAVLFIEPGNASQLAGHLETLLADQSLQKSLRAKGKMRAAQFSWQKAAKQTMAVFEKVCNTG